ncbi:MAG: hypothetical protein ACI857_001037 [Arenicella sp.]|jgi:hypothetical protein
MALFWLGAYFYITLSWNKSTTFYWQVILSRTILIAFIGLTFIWIKFHWKSFFGEKGSAHNLSIFRMVFFGFFSIGFFFTFQNLASYLLEFSHLPMSARVDLPLFSGFYQIIPLTDGLVYVAIALFGLSSILALVGFKTRIAIAIFVITALYIFLIPNLYGKVNHNQHIIWFSALLIFSPCADVWSIDSWIKRKNPEPLVKAQFNYQLPFKLMWVLMSLIYFFPGFWKVWTSGLDWAFTDNVRNQMYWKWYELGDWVPFFRIDLYPILYKFSGFYTIAFELMFIWLIFNRRTRLLGAALGIIFHLGTWSFMNIFFVVLVISYVSFINWENLFPFLKNKLESTSIDDLVPKRNLGLKLVAGFLIIGNLCFGVLKLNSWPLTVYPVFDTIVSDHTKTLSYSYDNEEGKKSFLEKDILKKHFTPERYRNMEQQIIQAFEENDLDDQRSLLQSIVSVFSDTLPSKIDVYIEHISVKPADSVQVLNRKVIYPG